MTTDIRPPYPSEPSDGAANADPALSASGSDALGVDGQSGPAIASDPSNPTQGERPARAIYRGVPYAAVIHADTGEPLGYPDPNGDKVYRGVRYSEGGERYAPEKIQITQRSRLSLLQWFYDLQVADKQLAGLLASKVLSVLGVFGISLLLLLIAGRRQLLEQAASELSATVNNLQAAQQLKGQIGGPTRDSTLLAAAETYAQTGQLDEQQAQQVRLFLQAEMRDAQLEYVTLIGSDLRVIASGTGSGTGDRSGELFNADNLVSEALNDGQPKVATSLVPVAQLQRLGVEVPANAAEAALIRYQVMPIFLNNNSSNNLAGDLASDLAEGSPARGEVAGALVTGDIVNGDSPEVANALTQFPQGYSAIYRQDPSGGFELAAQGQSGKIEPAQGPAQPYVNPDFLTRVVRQPGVVSERFNLPDGDYTVAAQALSDGNGQPVGVVLRGLPEQKINQWVRRAAWWQLGAALLALLADVIIAKLLGRSIVKPVRNLQAATEKFASGDRTARAEVFSRDEVGRVASAFNELAAAVSTSETSLRFQSQTQSEAAKRSQLLADLTSQIRQNLEMDSIFATAVERARELLEVDRVLVYRFTASYDGGHVVAESVGKGWIRAKGEYLEDPMLPNSMERFKSGKISYVQDIDKENLAECHCRLLRELEVKANMVAPIVVADDLIGLLCAHQCSSPRQWQPEELSWMQQISTQVGYALAQARLLQGQRQAVTKEQQLTSLVTRIRETSDREKIFRIVTRQVKLAVESSRVIIYLFDPTWSGTVVAEAVDPQWPPALGAEITDPCFADRYVEQYKSGRVKATTDIYKAGLTPCHLSQLEPFKVRANLVAPIVVEDRLLGLLVAHECEGPREWSDLTINFIQRAATQLGYALEQAEATRQKDLALAQTAALAEERRQRQELLQSQLVELLGDVEAVADGNLTVRADVTAGEIGTVADFFNAIVENLRQVVTQVKRSANQVNTSLGQNENAIRILATEALQQADQTTLTLDSVEAMTASIQQVAQQAQEAAAVAKAASENATAGGEAMDLTVNNIMTLRQTVGQTAKKVKRLGESSQQITKAVSLINQISQQTNLLAINAGIEAARAGEEGQGFAAVAEEVSELASRSAAATDEIERIVETIQRETSDVVEAIEQSTTQVVEGTRRVEEAKASLNEILAGSQKMDELARQISAATGSQAATSASVSDLMEEIAQLSKRTSESSFQVSEALKRTVAVAQDLQTQVATFVVEEG
jgi:twitching motility protein PilJ